VVEQVGRNVYWSENINAGGGVSSAGYINVRTTIPSMVRVKTGVIEIQSFGEDIFGTGKIIAFFH